MKKRLTILLVLIIVFLIASPFAIYSFTREIALDLDYAQGRIEKYEYRGERLKTLLIELEEKMAILSTSDGWKKVRFVANHYTPLQNPATGTGTDSIIIVSGKGPLIKCTGGHCKMGELIARVVKKAVPIAIERQNGLVPSRNLESRLRERGIGISRLVKAAMTLYPEFIQKEHPELEERLEKELKRELEYVNVAGLITADLYLEDAASRGLVPGLRAEVYQKKAPHFRLGKILGRQIAQGIGGEAALPLFAHLTPQPPESLKGLPPVITNLCQGIAAGIIAEVNSQLGLLRAELIIDFGPINRPGIKKFLILKQGTTVARALDSVVPVRWGQRKPHNLLALAIEGVKNSPENKLWWLYNVNGLHPFNIPADEYIVKEGDRIQWFLEKSGQYLPTK